MKYLLFVVLAVGLSACSQAQDATPESSAAVDQTPPAAQAATSYPAPVQALVERGFTIKGTLQAPPGYQGYVADFGGSPMPLYLLPDGKHAVVGTLFGAAGKNLTEVPFGKAAAPTLEAAVWARLGESTWIAEGAVNPKRIVYVFTDTECPFCHKLWQATQPMLAHGDVQVRHVVVAVIAPESAGRAAAILGASDRKAALHRHEKAFGHSPIVPLQDIPADAARSLHENGVLMTNLGIRGTPGIVYKDADGKVRVAFGLQQPDRIKDIFGSSD